MPAFKFRRRFFYGRRLKPEDTAAGVEKGTGVDPSPDPPELPSYARGTGRAASPRKKQLSRKMTLPRSLSKISIAPDPAILNAGDLGEIVMEIVLATGLRAPNGSTIGQAPSPFVKLAVRGKEQLSRKEERTLYPMWNDRLVWRGKRGELCTPKMLVEVNANISRQYTLTPHGPCARYLVGVRLGPSHPVEHGWRRGGPQSASCGRLVRSDGGARRGKRPSGHSVSCTMFAQAG